MTLEILNKSEGESSIIVAYGWTDVYFRVDIIVQATDEQNDHGKKNCSAPGSFSLAGTMSNGSVKGTTFIQDAKALAVFLE